MSYSFKNNLLIAMPNLDDVHFHRSVVYLYEHNEFGAMGIIINKPLKITLADVLEHLKIPFKNPQIDHYPVMLGGPVAPEQGFIIHRTRVAKNPLAINGDIAVLTSREALQTIAETEELQNTIVSLGYANWAAGQLESEMAENSWLLAPYNPQILFNVPLEECWRIAAASIGVDIQRLSLEVGHA